MSENFSKKHCVPCEGGAQPMPAEDVRKALQNVPGWSLSNDGLSIHKDHPFHNFKEVMFFVNAIAFIAENEGHHPDINFGYNYCHVSFTTHAIKGLSENDFICAARINGLGE